MTDKTSFGLILLLWFAGLGAAAQYGKVSVVFDQLPLIYPDAGAALGFVVSIVGVVGIVLGVAAGLVISRIGYRTALLWGLWAGAGLSLLQATIPPLWVMLVLRCLEGVSHLAIVVVVPTLIAQLSAERHRGFTLTLWGTFFGVAYTVLVVLGLPLVQAYGLPALFLAHGLWMAGFALILTARLNRLASTSASGTLSIRQLARDHVTLYRSPFMSAPAIGWLFYTFSFLSLLTLLPPFIDASVRSSVLGAMPLISIVSSMTLGVALLARFPAVQVILLGFGLVLIMLAWLWVDPGLPIACLGLASAFGLVQGASFAAVPQLNSTAETQVSANGAMAQMGNIGNTIGTPILFAILGVAGYSGMIWTAAVVIAAGIIAHLTLGRARRRVLAGPDT